MDITMVNLFLSKTKEKELLFYLEYKTLIIYIVIIVISIYIAYYFGIRKIEKDDIVDILGDESI